MPTDKRATWNRGGFVGPMPARRSVVDPLEIGKDRAGMKSETCTAGCWSRAWYPLALPPEGGMAAYTRGNTLLKCFNHLPSLRLCSPTLGRA